jgi:transcriptional regulator with XRE-family HTH domain
MTNAKTIGQRIKLLRKSSGMSQAEVAEALGLARSTYGEMETGTEPGGLATMLAVADYFKVPMDWLLGRSPPAGGPVVGSFVNDPDELAWLSFWRDMDENERTGVLAFLSGGRRRLRE